MPSFVDAKGRNWEIKLDVFAIERVREVDPKFLAGEDPVAGTVQRLEEDILLLCRVIHVLCREQIESRQGFTDGDFHAGLTGDGVDAAMDALLEAIVDFSPRRQRDLLKLTVQKNRRIRDLAIEESMARLNDPKFEANLMAALNEQMDAVMETALTRLASVTS